MNLAPAQAIVVQVVEAGIREFAVERPQFGQVERILRPVVDGSQEPD